MMLRTAVAALVLAPILAVAEPFSFPRATPESQGVRSAAVSAFVERLNEEGDMAHAYMLIRHGKVIAEGCWAPYSADVPHALYSISKAFTSMAIGYAVEDRKMTLNDRVDWFFPEYAPTNEPGFARELRVRDLMQMASGHRRDPLSAARSSGETNWPKAFYSVPVLDPPGLIFRYMTGNSCMLAQIHRKVTGAPDMIDYLKPRLFDKLGVADMYWDRQPDGTVFGGSGFHLRLEDLAKVSQLLLQRGVWRGERILPLWWVKQATSLQTPYGSVMDPVLALHLGAKDAKGLPDPSNDWQQGYGFQMWMGRHETFRLCGAYGQIGVVMPNEDIVCVVLAGGNGSNKLSVNALYDTILPALSDSPLPEDPSALAALKARSAALSITLPARAAEPSPDALKAAERAYAFSENPRGLKRIKFDPARRVVEFENSFGAQTLAVGEGSWATGEISAEPVSTKATNVLPGGLQKVGAAGAWIAPDTYRISLCFLAAPHIMKIDLQFAGGSLAATFDCPLAGIKSQRVLGVAKIQVDNFRPAPIPPASQARIREIASMLPEKPGMPGGYSQDRQTWERLARLPEAKEVIKLGESALAEPIPELSDEGYLEFNGKGDRARYQKPFGRRSTLLKDLLLAECLERKGRFLPKICTCIDAICSERSWTLPAHDEDLGNFNGNKLSVDLASGARAFLLATTLNWLGGSIPSAVEERVRAEISRRVFAPYLKTARGQDAEYRVNPFVNNVGNWWFAFPNNWNAVCHSCVVRTALAIVEDREARAEFVEAAERTRESYLDAFTPDGYCDEGMGYWNYGYGHELSLGLFVRRATGGKVDFFKHPKDRNIMLYPYGYMLEKGKSPHFADGGGNPNPSVLALGRQVWPDIVSSDALDAPILACSTKRSGSKGYNVSLEIIALRAFGGEPPRVSSAMPLDTLPIRTFFPDAQVLISRTPASGAHHFAIAMKGGHNAELHNHNDVGSYALMLDGDEIAGDPGGEIYTRRTFSPRRYESKVLSSYAHPVPYPAGTLQSQGRSFAGKVLKADFSDAKDVYSLDLKGAYEVPGLLSLVRTLEFDRARMRAEIADEVAFESPSSFAVPVITYCEVEKGADGRSFTLLSKGRRRVKVSVSATGGEWRLAEEIVKNPGRSDVRRLAVEMVSPVKRAAVKMSFEAQLAPAGK